MARIDWLGAIAAMVTTGAIGFGCGFDSTGTGDDTRPRESDDANATSESSSDGGSSSSEGSTSEDGSDGTDTGSCVTVPFYGDADGDGFGRAEAVVMACSPPEGHASEPGDCDDSDAEVHPNAVEICNDRDDDCDDATDEWSDDNAACNGCQATLTEANLYYVCVSGVSWSEAAAACEARGAALSSILDQAENDFVAELLVDRVPWVWIGLSDVDREGTFTWDDGSSFEYANWGGGQPDDSNGNQDCVMLGRGPRQWFDRQCNNPDNPDDQKARGFVCKAPLP